MSLSFWSIFKREGKLEREVTRQTDTASAVMQAYEMDKRLYNISLEKFSLYVQREADLKRARGNPDPFSLEKVSNQMQEELKNMHVRSMSMIWKRKYFA